MIKKQKYYKALLKEPYMTSKYGNMKFEIGKTYKLPKGTELEFCKSGFHYTDNVYYLSCWFDKGEYDIFEVVPGGKAIFDQSQHQYCSENITIVKKLSDRDITRLYDKEFDNMIKNEDANFRRIGALCGRSKVLDTLVNDEDLNVRLIVASHKINRHLNILINDKTWEVRYYVASIGRPQDLDILVHDENDFVRYAVAKHGRPKDYDILKNDKYIFIKQLLNKL